MVIEIGGVHARRRSNRAGLRSRLTFRSLLQQFPPNRGLLVCDDSPQHRSQVPRGRPAPPWTSWPQAPESPTLRPTPAMACGMTPVPVITGVSEASNRRGHPIPVVGGLASQPLIISRVAQGTNERARPSFQREGRPSSFLDRRHPVNDGNG